VARTNTEAIRDLEKNVAVLEERVFNLRSDLAALEKAVEESDRKRWNLTMSFIGAFLALLCGLIANLLRK
jgi:hypothetical protein